MNLNESIIRIKEVMGLITEQSTKPQCSNLGCNGSYKGPEFQNGSDVAHQYSNIITKAVSEKLKDLYKSGTYTKVDLKNITLSTEGMGSGYVIYTVNIPFITVSDKCEARTGFAHVGGWNHTPELESRKSEILNYIPNGKTTNIVLNNELDISPLTKTPEGLQEYWIQWKHSDFQNDCNKKIKPSNEVKIVGTDLNDFRNQIKNGTNNVSLDEDSLVFNPNNLTLSFRNGDTKIKNLSLIFDPDKQNLNSRLDSIKEKNPTLKVIKKGNFSEGTNVFYFALSIIY